MPLTPQDVELKQFAKVFRGYDMEEVDEFLDQVEAELSRLLTENQALASRAAAGGSGRPAAPEPTREVATVEPSAPPASSMEPEESQQAALRTLLMAQRTADQAISEAREEAERVLSDARRRYSQVETEINSRTANALSELEGRRVELESKIEDLRAFEREYRLRLKAYLETQLKDLDTRGGGSEGVGSGVPAAARSAAVGVLTPGVAQSAAAQPAPAFAAPSPTPAATPAAPAPAPAASAAPAAPAPQPPGRPTVQLPEEPFTDDAPSAQHTTHAAAPAGPPLEAGQPAVGPFTPVPPPVPVDATEITRPSGDDSPPQEDGLPR